MNIFQELQKRGYQITNIGLINRNRIDGSYQNYSPYSSDEEYRKDLIQELALVIEWLFRQKIVISTDFTDTESNYGFQYCISLVGNYEFYDEEMRHKCKEIWDFTNYFDTPQEATIAAIEYLIENKLI